MDSQEIKKFLRRNELFSTMNEAALEQIAAISSFMKLDKNEILIHEGSKANYIYIITNGKFSVYSHSETKDHSVKAHLSILNAGDTVGELAFIDYQPRSATVMALEDNAAVIRIPYTELHKLATSDFFIKLSKILSKNLRTSNETLINNLRNELIQSKKLLNLGKFVVYVLLLIAFYNLTLKGLVTLVVYPYTNLFASTSVIFIFTVVLTILVRHMGYPLSNYGLNLKNWKTALLESLLFTFLLILAVTGLKWIIIKTIPSAQHMPLIDFSAVINFAHINSNHLYLWLTFGILVYVIFVNLQEFIARGVLQGSLQDFLQMKHKDLIANIVSSGVFAAMHIHLYSSLALIMFIPSLFWGWLYIRHRTLLGPVVSHIIVGAWAIFALGIDQILK